MDSAIQVFSRHLNIWALTSDGFDIRWLWAIWILDLFGTQIPCCLLIRYVQIQLFRNLGIFSAVVKQELPKKALLQPVFAILISYFLSVRHLYLPPCSTFWCKKDFYSNIQDILVHYSIFLDFERRLQFSHETILFIILVPNIFLCSHEGLFTIFVQITFLRSISSCYSMKY